MKPSQATIFKKPWRKILFVKQDYPDNFVDISFLDEMQKNGRVRAQQLFILHLSLNFLVNVRTYDYWTLVFGSSNVSQQINSVVLFICVFYHMHMGYLSPWTLITLELIFSTFGYLLWVISLNLTFSLQTRSCKFYHISPTVYRGGLLIKILFDLVLRTVKGSGFFFVTMLGLVPILKTLTEDTSSDTIWALTVLFTLANLAFHDYSSVGPCVKYVANLECRNDDT